MTPRTSRNGRKRTLSAPRSRPLAQHICQLINERYQGNVSRAAQAMGLDRANLWRIARGLTARQPSMEVLQAIATHFGTTVGAMVEAATVRRNTQGQFAERTK